MTEHSKDGNVKRASMLAGMDRKTGAKYVGAGKTPTQLQQERGERMYRTRVDPFECDWPVLERMLIAGPGLEAKALFSFLMEARCAQAEALRAAGKAAEADAIVQYEPGQVRTFQRKVKQWRATSGPPREVFFSQEHVPGEGIQTDFTWANTLGVTIAGELFPHMLCHSVLPYSNWQWATVCRTENFLALKSGVQNVLFRIGHTPVWHQTDQSTTATHKLGDMTEFNDDYQALVTHYGMTPRTIGVGKKEQNGDIEAANGALKRRLEQHLLLRGCRDFDTVEDYEAFIAGVLKRANKTRQTKFAEEQAAMKVLNVARLPDYKEIRVTVSTWSTIQVQRKAYSVPSRMIGETVKVRVYDARVEVWYAQKLAMSVDRLVGDKRHSIDYRHIIWSLVRKPGAFERYRYREDLFPSLIFRRAFDALETTHGASRKANQVYLNILHHAAATMECDVEIALSLLLDAAHTISLAAVKSLVGDVKPVDVPAIEKLQADLTLYDGLVPSMEAQQ